MVVREFDKLTVFSWLFANARSHSVCTLFGRVIVVRFPGENALLLILVTLFEMVTDVSGLLLNALCPISVMLLGIFTVVI